MTTTTSNSESYTITVGREGVDLQWRDQTFTIEPSDLTDGGWQFEPTCDRDHCSDGDCPSCIYCDGDGNLPSGGEALKRWHDEHSGHEGPFRFCYAEPCKSVGEAIGALG